MEKNVEILPDRDVEETGLFRNSLLLTSDEEIDSLKLEGICEAFRLPISTAPIALHGTLLPHLHYHRAPILLHRDATLELFWNILFGIR